jgi:glutathione S-transferase
MKLYLLPGAPNPTKVALYVAEKAHLGIDLGLEVVIVNVFKNEQNQPDHLARNPFGTMPVLESASGQHIFESLPIIEYLEELHPTPSMWGKDIETRATARNVERVADVRLLNPSAGYVHAVNSPLGLKPEPKVAEACEQNFRKAFKFLDELLADNRSFMLGEQVSVADCTVAAALQFMRFRELEDLADYPNVARWSSAYRQREVVQSVLIF